MLNRLIVTALSALALAGCRGDKLPPPVAIFPEDVCSNCKMALSQSRFASEFITAAGDVRKFDDLRCLSEYRREMKPSDEILVTYLRDYDADRWHPADSCVVVRTGIATPMGSGLVAVADSARARDLLAQHPPAAAP